MGNEKRIKLIIIISLLLIETFVWTVNGAVNFWSLGLTGGAKEPITIIDGEDKDKPGKESPTDENPPNQKDENPPEDTSGRDLEIQQAVDKGLLILVNKQHPVDQAYKPDDLEKIKYFVSDRSETTRYMRSEAAEAFHRMVEEADTQDGIVLKMTTAYRTSAFQKILFDNYVAKEGEEAANKYSARPGQSEHQTGLAVDVSSPSVDYQLSNDYDKTDEGKWLADHAYLYGFIIRFPKGKEEITGYQYEPWHIRYVGLTAAKEIYEQKLTLEEYLQRNDIE